MAFGVTHTGFVKKTLQECKAELEGVYQSIWPTVDLDPDGEAGQRIGLSAKRESEIWDMAQDVYTTTSPSEATGAAQDNLYALVGLTRIDASPTVVNNALHWGSSGTVILANSKAKMSGTQKQFALQADVTLSNTLTDGIRLQLGAYSDGKVYSIILGSYTFTKTAGSSDTIDTIGAYFVGVMNTNFITTYASGILKTKGKLSTSGFIVPFTVGILTEATIVNVGGQGVYFCSEDGANACPANTLDTIVTPISGWDTVENPYAGTTGRLVETDDQFRLRQAGFYAGGKATEPAIRANVLNTVSGVISCNIRSNRTMSIDSEGLPPKSFQCVVEGGVVLDIAQAILDSEPAGIESYGNTSVTLDDDQGVPRTIKFSVPTQALIWVKVTRTLDSDGGYPVDGDSQIKKAIVEWALTHYSAGLNVYTRDILTPINTIPGLADVLVELGNSRTTAPPGSYSSTAMTMTLTESPIFDIVRIMVV
jgi:hypothetical protein